MSLAIFSSAVASSRSAALNFSIGSCAAIAMNRLSAGRNGTPPSCASRAHTRADQPGGALSPVPTAVAPSASASSDSRASAIVAMQNPSCAA